MHGKQHALVHVRPRGTLLFMGGTGSPLGHRSRRRVDTYGCTPPPSQPTWRRSSRPSKSTRSLLSRGSAPKYNGTTAV